MRMFVFMFMRRDDPGRAGTAEAHGEKDVDVAEAAASAVAAAQHMGVPGAVLEVRCRLRPSPLPNLAIRCPAPCQSALRAAFVEGRRACPAS